MMKNIAGALLVGLAVLTFTPTAFAGQAAQAGQAREFVGGYHVTATDDCAGNLNYLDAAEKPVEVDLGADSARVKILTADGGEQCYDFNRKAAPGRFVSAEGYTLDVNDANNLRMVTGSGIDYIGC